MDKKYRWVLLFFCSIFITPLLTDAQNGIPTFSSPAGTDGAPIDGGMVYAYMNAYSNAGTCTNSWEYQPPGFNFNDYNTKYPIIIFFPGLGQSITAEGEGEGRVNDTSFPLASALYSPGFRNPSIVKMSSFGLPQGILQGRALYNIPGPGGVNYNFIMVGVQCRHDNFFDENIDNYEKFIRGYVFEKYKNKIDPSRIYITGLSIGGGKTMEFFATSPRTSLIAAAAPVAIFSNCPYTPERINTYTCPTPPKMTWENCLSKAEYEQILTNLRGNPNIGVWFNHNVDDESRAPYKMSKEFFYDPLMTPLDPFTPRPNTGGYFNPAELGDCDGHEAWSNAYYIYTFPQQRLLYGPPNPTTGDRKNMFSWFLDYQSTDATILPVILKNFSASLDPAGSVSLQWTTTLESHTSHFEVERSFDGTLFGIISKVPAKGNSNSELKYVFLDQDPGESFTFYRIKIMDQDGRYEYSPTQKVSRQNRGLSFSVNPNPVNTEFVLNVSGKAILNLELTLADQAGRIIKRFTAAKSRGELSQKFFLGDMAGGVYLLTIRGEGVNLTQRLVKF